MVYLPTFPLECGHFSHNVGKYTIHGSCGLPICKAICSGYNHLLITTRKAHLVFYVRNALRRT